MEPSTVRLRALSPTASPLADPRVRETVLASAHAIAERTGVAISDLHAGDDHVTVTIHADKLAALGFLAELRRTTERWYAAKHQGGTLWGGDTENGGPA